MLEGISALPLLKDALGFEWLEGRGTIALALAGQGASERQIVETLNGKVDMATANGAIDGFDVAKILRNIEQGRFAGLRVAPGEKTPFSELAGTYTIANGVAQNQDLRLVSPSLRVTGAGSVNLPQRAARLHRAPEDRRRQRQRRARRDQPRRTSRSPCASKGRGTSPTSA